MHKHHMMSLPVKDGPSQFLCSQTAWLDPFVNASCLSAGWIQSDLQICLPKKQQQEAQANGN